MVMTSEELSEELEKVSQEIEAGIWSGEELFLRGYNVGRAFKGEPPATMEEMKREMGWRENRDYTCGNLECPGNVQAMCTTEAKVSNCSSWVPVRSAG